MSRPLAGKTIVVTRPSGQQHRLVEMLQAQGANVNHWPALRIEPPDSWSQFDQFVRNCPGIDYAVFTSANGVRMCFDRLDKTGWKPNFFDGMQIAAVGPATARALADAYQMPVLVPEAANASQLFAALENDIAGKRVVLFRAAQGRTELRDALARLCIVDDVIVYQQFQTAGPPPEVAELLDSGRCHGLTFTSANSARAIIKHLSNTTKDRILGRITRIVVNSGNTANAVIELGLPVAHIADGSTDEEMVSAILRALT